MEFSEIKRLIDKGKYSQAKKLLEEYLTDSPETPSTLNLLATLNFMTGNFSKAVEALEKAAEQDPESAAPYINLGIVHFQKENLEKALRYFKKAVTLEENNPLARYNYALALSETGETDKAIAEFEKAVELKTDYPDALFHLSMLYLLKGNYKKGFELYELRFKTNELKRKELEGKRWNGERNENATLYVYSDQGFGDAIQFIRFLKIAKERVGKLVLEVQIELLELLKNSELCDRVVPTRPDFSPMTNYDFQIPLSSLPFALKIERNNIPRKTPYIFADKEKSAKWKALLDTGKKLRIGIAWRGNPVYRKNHIRSANVKFFKELFELKGTVFFSLQKDLYEREREFLLENEVVDMSELLHDFSETAAIMENLDLIITTDTVIPHLAAALGKPTWVLLSKIPDWRWGTETDQTVWYPTARLFRQPTRDDWQSVFDKVRNELIELLSKKS